MPVRREEDLLDGVRSCFVKGSMDAEGTCPHGIGGPRPYRQGYWRRPATAGVPPIIANFRKKLNAQI